MKYYFSLQWKSLTGSSDLKPLLANVDALRRYGHGVIRLLGAGRAGKTGLANNIMGKAFSDTESTTGMDVAALEISESKASVSGGDWRIATGASSDKAYESELAKALQATTSRSQTKDVSSSPPPSSTSSSPSLSQSTCTLDAVCDEPMLKRQAFGL